MADILANPPSSIPSTPPSVITASDLERMKQANYEPTPIRQGVVDAANLEQNKRAIEKSNAAKNEALIEQETQLSNNALVIQAEKDFADTHVQLLNKEWVNKEDFYKLPKEEQEMLMGIGIKAFNDYYGKKMIAEAGYTALNSGEYIATLEYSKLTVAEQDKLNELGIDKFNLWYADEQNVQAGYTKLNNGEWVSATAYNAMNEEDRAKLDELGVTGYNEYKKAQEGAALQEAIVAATPKAVPVLQGSGKASGFTGTQYIRTQAGDIPAWMLVADTSGAFTPSGGEAMGTSYGASVSGIKYAFDNQQEYRISGWGYASVGGYPQYSLRYRDTQTGEDVWIGQYDYITRYDTAGGASDYKASVLMKEGKIEPVYWTEDSYLAHLGISKEDVASLALASKYRYSDLYYNQFFSDPNYTYIDPETGVVKNTGGLVNPYGLLDNEGKVIQPMGTHPIYGSGVWTTQAAQAYQATDIGMWGNTGRISDYITDPRTLESRSVDISKAAFIFKTEGQLPDFPLMKEAGIQIAKQAGTMPIETTPPVFVTAAEAKVQVDVGITLSEEQLVLLAAAIEKGIVNKDFIVTDVVIDKENNTYSLEGYTPKSAKAAFDELKSNGKVPEYAYLIDAQYNNGSWLFQLGDSRSPQQIFNEMVSEGKLPDGAKFLGFTGTNGQYSFEYQMPETQQSKDVKQALTKYEYLDPVKKEWATDYSTYAYDKWNSGKTPAEIAADLKAIQLNDESVSSVLSYIGKTGLANDSQFKSIISDTYSLNNYQEEHPDDPRLFVAGPGALPRYMMGADTYSKAIMAERTNQKLLAGDWSAFSDMAGQYNQWITKEKIINVAIEASKSFDFKTDTISKDNPINKILSPEATGALNTISGILKDTTGIPPMAIYNAIKAGVSPDLPSGSEILANIGDGVYEANSKFNPNTIASWFTDGLRASLVTEVTKGKTADESKQIIKDLDSSIIPAIAALQGGATYLSIIKFMPVDVPIVALASFLDITDGRVSSAVDKVVSTGMGLINFPVTGAATIGSLILDKKFGEAIGMLGGTVAGFTHIGGGKLPEKTVELYDGTKVRIELNDVRRTEGVPIKKGAEVAMASAENTVKAYITREQVDVPFKMYDTATGSTYTVKLAKERPASVDLKYTVNYDATKGANEAALDTVFKQVDTAVQSAIAKDGILKKAIVQEYSGIIVKAEPVIATIETQALRLKINASALKTAEENLQVLADKFASTTLDYKGKALIDAELVQKVGNLLTKQARTDFAEVMQKIKLKEPMQYDKFAGALELYLSAVTREEVMKVLRKASPSDYATLTSNLQHAKIDYLKAIRQFKESFEQLTEGLTIEELTAVGKEINQPNLPIVVEKYHALIKELSIVENELLKEQALFTPEKYPQAQVPSLQIKAEKPKTLAPIVITAGKEGVGVPEVSKPSKVFTYSDIPKQPDGKLVDSISIGDGIAEIKISRTENGRYALNAEVISNTDAPVLINGQKLIGGLKYGDKISIGDIEINWVPVDLYMPENVPFDIVMRSEGTKQWLDKNLSRLGRERAIVVGEVGKQLGLNIIDLENATVKELGFFLGNLVSGSVKDIPAGIKTVVVGHAESVGGGKLSGKGLQEFLNEVLPAGEEALAVICDKNTARYMGKAEGKLVKSEASAIKENAVPIASSALSRFEKLSEQEFEQLSLGGESVPFKKGNALETELNEVQAVSANKKPMAYVGTKEARDSARSLGLETQMAQDMNGHPSWVVFTKGNAAIVDKFINLREKWGITGEKLPDALIESLGKNAKYHIELGEMLGYTDADIAKFINNDYVGGYQGLKQAFEKGESTGWDMFIADKGKIEGAGLLSLEKDGVLRTEIPLGNDISIISIIPPGVKIPTSVKLVFPEGQNVLVNGNPVLSGVDLKYGSYIKTGERKVWFAPKEINPANLAAEFESGMAKSSKGKSKQAKTVTEKPVIAKEEIVKEPTLAEMQGVVEFDVSTAPTYQITFEASKAKQLQFESKFQQVSKLRQELENTITEWNKMFEVPAKYQERSNVIRVVSEPGTITKAVSEFGEVEETAEGAVKAAGAHYYNVDVVLAALEKAARGIEKESIDIDLLIQPAPDVPNSVKIKWIKEADGLRKQANLKPELPQISRISLQKMANLLYKKAEGSLIISDVTKAEMKQRSAELKNEVSNIRATLDYIESKIAKGETPEISDKFETQIMLTEQGGIGEETTGLAGSKWEGQGPKTPTERGGGTRTAVKEKVEQGTLFDIEAKTVEKIKSTPSVKEEVKIPEIITKPEVSKPKAKEEVKVKTEEKPDVAEEQKLNELADKLARGEKADNPDELQLQVNFKTRLEQLLKERLTGKTGEKVPQKIKSNAEEKNLVLPKKEAIGSEYGVGEAEILDTRIPQPIRLPVKSGQATGQIKEFPQALPKEYTETKQAQIGIKTLTSPVVVTTTTPETTPYISIKEQQELERQNQLEMQTQGKTKPASELITKVQPQSKALTKTKPQAQVQVKTKIQETTRLKTPVKTTVKVPPVDKIKIPIKTLIGKPEVKYHQLTEKQKQGILAYKQGFMYILRYPPYKDKVDVIYSRKPIGGVKYYKGIGSAQKSVVLKGGSIDKALEFDQGAVDLIVGKTVAGAEPKFRYIRDIQYRHEIKPIGRMDRAIGIRHRKIKGKDKPALGRIK